MDRGVKIAIFVASVVSLGLGLIWDQVLSHTRDIVAEEKPDPMGPERIKARIGPKELQRKEIPAELAPDNAAQPEQKPSQPAVEPKAEKPEAGGSDEYVVQAGDSPSKICHRIFKDRNLQTKDLFEANPGVDFAKLQPGMKLRIPKQGTKKPAAAN